MTYEPKEPGDGENIYSVTQKQLSDYFMPQENMPYERHLFRNMTQNSDETVDQYITRLRQRVEFCKFGDQANEQIRDQVMEKCVSHHLRRKLLEKGQDLTLDQLRTIARAFESSEKQAQSIAMGSSMKTETDPVNFVKSRGNKTNRNSHHM